MSIDREVAARACASIARKASQVIKIKNGHIDKLSRDRDEFAKKIIELNRKIGGNHKPIPGDLRKFLDETVTKFTEESLKEVKSNLDEEQLLELEKIMGYKI